MYSLQFVRLSCNYTSLKKRDEEKKNGIEKLKGEEKEEQKKVSEKEER